MDKYAQKQKEIEKWYFNEWFEWQSKCNLGHLAVLEKNKQNDLYKCVCVCAPDNQWL